MIDVKLLRTDLPAVFAALKKRGYELDQNRFQQLESQRKYLQTETQRLQGLRNTESKKIGKLKAQGDDVTSLVSEVGRINQALTTSEAELKTLLIELDQFLYELPNLPLATVPVGISENDNVEVRTWGTPPEFAHPVADHTSLGESLNQLDFEKATQLTGSRFVVMKGGLARLHRALAQFMLDTHVDAHGYQEMNVPLIVSADTLRGTGQLPKFEEDQFSLQSDQSWYLIPTAEVPLTNLVRDEIIEDHHLPLQFVAHTPCFRREAGSYGRDTRGMIRQHQFEKVELVHIVRPEEGEAALERLTGHAETILQKLNLPYRVVELCTGDMGFSAQKTYDLEVWLPSQQTYREISSCSLCGDFQARRMRARWRNPATGKPELVHTLNGSGLAIGRTLIAVMENYQTESGHINIPEVLQPYLKGETEIR